MMRELAGERGQVRTDLLGLYQAALAAVEGSLCVARRLRAQPPDGPVRVVAIGKAAASMLDGAVEVLGTGIEQALLITKTGHLRGRPPPGTEVLEAGHPLPDQASLAAGQRLLEVLAAAPARAQWLFLISGGASSLVEVPVPGVGLEELRQLNRWLLASGLPIAPMNALRRRVSRIKGGQLLAWLRGRPVRALLISDVPDDDPSIIGSGLLFPPTHQVPVPDGRDCPEPLRALLTRLPVPEASPPGATPVRAEIVARLDQALAAAEAAARTAGLPVYRAPGRLAGEAADVGRRLADTVLQGPAGVYLWGGETTVRLPPRPGRGGRCQHLALAAAEVLAGHRGIGLLAGGSDGSDGPGEVAGACIDAQTLARGQAAGLDAATALARADAGGFLAAAGDLLDTGPTGTNVTDIVIGLKQVSDA
ncbi:MAG: glycerate kinase [Gammaproteobacteria bacterium]